MNCLVWNNGANYIRNRTCARKPRSLRYRSSSRLACQCFFYNSKRQHEILYLMPFAIPHRLLSSVFVTVCETPEPQGHAYRHQHSQNNIETCKKWTDRHVWSLTIATADVPAVATASIITVYIIGILFRCTLSETQSKIFSCTLYLAAKDFVRNVSAANPAHLLSFTLDKRRNDPADVRCTTRRMSEHSLYRDL